MVNNHNIGQIIIWQWLYVKNLFLLLILFFRNNETQFETYFRKMCGFVLCVMKKMHSILESYENTKSIKIHTKNMRNKTIRHKFTY